MHVAMLSTLNRIEVILLLQETAFGIIDDIPPGGFYAEKIQAPKGFSMQPAPNSFVRQK